MGLVDSSSDVEAAGEVVLHKAEVRNTEDNSNPRRRKKIHRKPFQSEILILLFS